MQTPLRGAPLLPWCSAETPALAPGRARSDRKEKLGFTSVPLRCALRCSKETHLQLWAPKVSRLCMRVLSHGCRTAAREGSAVPWGHSWCVTLVALKQPFLAEEMCYSLVVVWAKEMLKGLVRSQWHGCTRPVSRNCAVYVSQGSAPRSSTWH